MNELCSENRPVVAKFGGSSMARPDVVLERLDEYPETNVVVTSAPGRTVACSEKITDMLKAYEQAPAAEARAAIVERYRAVGASVMASESLQALLEELDDSLDYGLRRPDSQAFIASRGEHFAAKLLAAAAGGEFVEAEMVRFADNGVLDKRETLARIDRARSLGALAASSNGLAVVPGYYGYDDDNNVHLLERGGSDRTGALLAVGMGAGEYHNWTDVDGIYSGNPKQFGEDRVKLLPEITRREVREGAHGGNQVLAGNALRDIRDSRVDVVLRSTWSSEATGTRIARRRESEAGRPVLAVASTGGEGDSKQPYEINVYDQGMAEEVGYIENMLDTVRRHGASLEHMPMTNDTANFVISGCSGADAQSIEAELRDYIDSQHRAESYLPESADDGQEAFDFAVSPPRRVGMVYLVGEALSRLAVSNRVKTRAIDSLSARGIEAEDSSASASPSLALIVEATDTAAAAGEMHRLFVEEAGSASSA